jgi:hypothetical protein
VADESVACARPPAKDWASDRRAFLMLWGLPAGAMIVAGLLSSTPRAIVWTVALIWMGGICLANARRCGRTHCLFTGPFLILMAAIVVAYAVGSLPLGSNGWNIISGVSLVGSAALWWGSEHVLGAYRHKRMTSP